MKQARGLFFLGWLTICAISLSAAAQEVPVSDTDVPTDSPPTISPVVQSGETDAGVPIAEPAPQEKYQRQWFFEGYASEQYRFRYATSPIQSAIENSDDILAFPDGKSETDHDLRLFVTGYLWEDSDHFAADLSLGFWYDLNGISVVGEPTAFASVNDYNFPQDPVDVFTLYAEYHSAGVLALARGGRQTSEYGRPITFDGATVQLQAMKPYLDFVVFGGRTVHFFELDDNLFEDWVASAVTVVRPLPYLRIELDYRFAAEDTTSKDNIMDHSYGLTAWYRITDWSRIRGYVRGLNDKLSDVGGGPLFEWTDLELGIEAGVKAQLITLRELNELDDPYFAVLGESLPHVLIHSDVWKDFTTDVGIYSIHVGWNGRLLTEDEPTEFNRDYGRIYLLLQATDIGIPGPFASFISEYHYTHKDPSLAEDSLFTVGGSVGYDWKKIKGEAGSYFYRYKYDYYIDVRELSDVRTFFGEFRYDPFKWLSVRLRYEYERFDRDIHTVTLNLAQTY